MNLSDKKRALALIDVIQKNERSCRNAATNRATAVGGSTSFRKFTESLQAHTERKETAYEALRKLIEVQK